MNMLLHNKSGIMKQVMLISEKNTRKLSEHVGKKRQSTLT